MKIKGRTIGEGAPCYIIAEISANHNQNYEDAESLVHLAKECGADAVKLQTYTADTITLDCKSDLFKIGKGSLWEDQYLHDLYQEAYTPWEWQPKLKDLADEIGIHCFSSPFDLSSIEFLEEMDVPAYKIASPELVDIPLIEAVAKTGKPVIMSTGMGTLEEISEAVDSFKNAGGKELILLKCTSGYPAPFSEMNLKTMEDLGRRFHVPVGLSDHSLGIEVPIASIALGACVIEKHFTLDRDRGGPDAAFSLNPDEFKEMVKAVRNVEASLGRVQYEITPKEVETRKHRRSLFVTKDVKAGDKVSHENIRSVRPAYGLHTRELKKLLGLTFVADVEKGVPLSCEMVRGND